MTWRRPSGGLPTGACNSRTHMGVTDTVYVYETRDAAWSAGLGYALPKSTC